MGISDEDYGRAIKDLQEIKALSAVQVEQMIEQVKQHVDQPYGRFKVLEEQDLQHEAMKAPLSSLVDMWVVRWSSNWVNESEFKDDNFWRIAFIRLTGADMLEKHHLANQFEAVYRVIE
jgi:hypothetical protein